MPDNAPTLNSDSLVLRAFQPEDAEAYFKAVLSDPEVMRALPTGRPVPRQRSNSIIAGIIDHWENQGYGLWAVILDNRLIGHSGLQALDQKNHIEFCYALQRPYASGEIAAQAGRLVLRYAFETLQAPEILALVFPGNETAKSVYSRLGMKAQRRSIHAYDQYLPYYVIDQGDFRY